MIRNCLFVDAGSRDGLHLYRCHVCGRPAASKHPAGRLHRVCIGDAARYAAGCRALLLADCRARHHPDVYPDYPWRSLAEIETILDRWTAAGTVSAPGCYERRQAIVSDLLYADRWRPEWGKKHEGNEDPSPGG